MFKTTTFWAIDLVQEERSAVFYYNRNVSCNVFFSILKYYFNISKNTIGNFSKTDDECQTIGFYSIFVKLRTVIDRKVRFE